VTVLLKIGKGGGDVDTKILKEESTFDVIVLYKLK
jgi:hypothetical protein